MPAQLQRAGLIAAPAWLASVLPTGTEPVKLTFLTTGAAISRAETWAGSPNTKFTTPSGKPASVRARTSAIAAPGASSAAFRMIVQAAATAGAILRAGRKTGKFQGVKAATTPIGCGTTDCCRPPASSG